MFTSLILSAMIALSAFLGQAPSSQVEAPKGGVDVGVECLEDMPCWDCETMGDKNCGPKVSAEVPAMESDAYLSFDALGTDPASHEGMMLSYVASYTSSPTNVGVGQFAIPSVQTEGIYHLMQWDILTEA